MIQSFNYWVARATLYSELSGGAAQKA